jgi:catechol 2,3-dioxygenase-like lactoylglutathione lyase family enzyme
MPDTPRLVRAVPVLASLDIARSVAFACGKLGFETVSCEPGVYGVVRRDAVVLHFWPCDDRRIAEATACRIEVDDVDALHAACAPHRIVHPNGPLRDTPWGTREFAVLDPDGNLITFQRAVG